jgi:hypothetical protein
VRDAQAVVEGQRLELRLRTVADEAMVRASGRASARAAITEVAAVRSAVASVSSDSNSGAPVATSASTPKAITVGRPCSALPGWPFTYLKL